MSSPSNKEDALTTLVKVLVRKLGGLVVIDHPEFEAAEKETLLTSTPITELDVWVLAVQEELERRNKLSNVVIEEERSDDSSDSSTS